MPVVDVINLEGKRVGQVELADAVFAAKVNPHLLHETVRCYLAAQRAGTHKVKGRGEVEGSGRKLWRQKGTGRARVGSIRSPLWRSGGTTHGPEPRDYSYRLPRKVRLGALRSALSAKLADEKLTVVDAFALESHKTKAFRRVLDKLGAERTTLLVDNAANHHLERASRNLVGVKLVLPARLETYDLLRHDRLVVSRDAALRLSASLSGQAAAAAAQQLVELQPAPAKPARAAKPAAAAAKPAEKKSARPRARKPAKKE
jgi:large subunit ribosomal protein L4